METPDRFKKYYFIYDDLHKIVTEQPNFKEHAVRYKDPSYKGFNGWFVEEDWYKSVIINNDIDELFQASKEEWKKLLPNLPKDYWTI